MNILLNGDCLELMKNLDDNSIDLIFCDLPYGQTSCKWDCCVDLEKFWIEVMRIKTINTPIIMTTTTKFGVSLINSAPKKCPFRYDLVWVKSAPAGFLSAKKMPMRKHEMVYVFYEKLPFYDLSSHQHKFIKTKPRTKEDIYGMKGHADGKEGKYTPPLPTSVVKEDNSMVVKNKSIYHNKDVIDYKDRKGGPMWDPPLPTSVVKEDYNNGNPKNSRHGANQKNFGDSVYQDPKLVRGMAYAKSVGEEGVRKYDPPLPNSMLEIKSTRGKHSTEKPVALMEWVLKYFSKEGDTILDPTMGSGSTGVACVNMNRKFIGFEKDQEIYEGAVKRLNDLKNNPLTNNKIIMSDKTETPEIKVVEEVVPEEVTAPVVVKKKREGVKMTDKQKLDLNKHMAKEKKAGKTPAEMKSMRMKLMARQRKGMTINKALKDISKV